MSYLIVCEHQIVPQECPYCELARLRKLTLVDSRLIVNAYIDGAAVGNHGDVKKRAEAYARDVLGDTCSVVTARVAAKFGRD